MAHVGTLGGAAAERAENEIQREEPLQETIQRMLKDFEAGKRPSPAELVALAHRIASMSPPITKPPYAEHLIREDRDSR